MLGRTVRLPFDHLVAELAAFPLGSEAALKTPLTDLDPNLTGSTGLLWRAAERELLNAAPGISLDELTALRDRSWFNGDDNNPVPLGKHLERTAMLHLEPSGTGVVVRRPAEMEGPWTTAPTYAETRRSWMWLTFALPADLLVAAAGSHPVAEPDILCSPVRELLSRGFAETHLHVGAAVDFAAVWALMVNRVAHPELGDRPLDAPGAPLDEGSLLLQWLVRASIARLLLGWYVTEGFPEPSSDSCTTRTCGERL